MLEIKDLTKVLRTNGYKVTPHRLAIYEALASTDTHPSAEELFNMLRPQYSAISLATIYKCMNMLHELGLVNILTTGDDIQHFDADVSPHNHIQCRVCGKIQDVRDLNGDILVKDAEQKSGYEILGHSFYFYGLCPECRKQH